MSEADYLEIVKRRTFAEEKDNVSTIICANLLDEIIDKVEEHNIFGGECVVDQNETELENTSDDDINILDPANASNKNSNADYCDILALMINELEYQNNILVDLRNQRSHLIQVTQLLRGKLINLCDNFRHVLHENEQANVDMIKTESIKLIKEIRFKLDEEFDDCYNNNVANVELNEMDGINGSRLNSSH